MMKLMDIGVAVMIGATTVGFLHLNGKQTVFTPVVGGNVMEAKKPGCHPNLVALNLCVKLAQNIRSDEQ
jgi:hypothetical protein